MARIQIVDTILKKEGKILMMRRNFWPKGKLDLPGGFVEKKESIEHAGIREVKEETGLVIEIIGKLGEFEYTDRGEKTLHVFLGEIIDGELKASEEGEPVWVEPKTVRNEDLAFPQVHRRVLEVYLKLHEI